MSSTQVEIRGLAELVNGLRKLSADALDKALIDATTQALADVQRIVAEPPPRNSTAFKRYATPAQKRAYWAQVRKGLIKADPKTGAYRRSNTIVRSLTSKSAMRVSRQGREIVGGLGTNKPGAIYVIGSAQPLFIRMIGWKRLDKTLQMLEAQGKVIGRYRVQLAHAIQRAGL